MKKKRIRIISLLFILTMPVTAQENSTWGFMTSEPSSLTTGSDSPIDVTKPQSVKTMMWSSLQIPYGDNVSKLTFYGYNSGKELRRHLKVWIKGDESLDGRNINMDDVDKIACVFDGDCTIPCGGTAESHIPLLDIPMISPFLYTKQRWLVVKVECTGDTMGNSVYFEYDDSYRFPVAHITVMSPVVYFSGDVSNQDGLPVANAHVRFYTGNAEYFAETDEQGHYTARIERGNELYHFEVKADGCADYLDGYVGLAGGKDTTGLNVVMYDAIRYRKDEPATIILPVKPDPTIGRFYRLDSWDGNWWESYRYYFVREEAPQANVPYVVFPKRDFEIHPYDYDTNDVLSESILVEHPIGSNVSVIGSYQNRIINAGLEVEHVGFIYLTPDCSYLNDEWGRSTHRLRVGAFRAYFYFKGSIVSDSSTYFFDGEPTSTSVRAVLPFFISLPLYDLQGRRLAAPPAKGIYVKGGRKVMVDKKSPYSPY